MAAAAPEETVIASRAANFELEFLTRSAHIWVARIRLRPDHVMSLNTRYTRYARPDASKHLTSRLLTPFSPRPARLASNPLSSALISYDRPFPLHG